MSNIPTEKEKQEAAEKPKKLFTIKLDIYDSGEVDPDLVEYIQGPLGRPKAWRLDSPELVRSAKAQLVGTGFDLFLEIAKSLGINKEQIQKYVETGELEISKE